MLKRVIETTNYLDWITPLAAEIQDRINGPAHTFVLPEACGLSANEIQRLLEGHGIRVWGVLFDGTNLLFSVPQDKAQWAQYILERHGLTALSGPPYPAPRTAPRAARQPGGLFDWLFDWLAPD